MVPTPFHLFPHPFNKCQVDKVFLSHKMFMSRTSGMFTRIPSANRIAEFQFYLNVSKTEGLHPKCKRESSHPHAVSRTPGSEKKEEIPIAQCINLVNPLIGLRSRAFETHSPLVMRREVLFKP